MAKNYYETLGLPHNATTRQVRERFLELAREQHPDRYRGDEKEAAEERFQEITQAFNVLSDANRRREHDLELVRPESQKQDLGAASRVYLQRGIKAYREREFTDAAQNFDRATQENPASAQAWYYLALACRTKRQWLPRARDAVLKACELEPMNAAYLKLAGEIFAESGMNKRAAMYYQKALTWGGDDQEISAALEALARRGDSNRVGIFGRRS